MSATTEFLYPLDVSYLWLCELAINSCYLHITNFLYSSILGDKYYLILTSNDFCYPDTLPSNLAWYVQRLRFWNIFSSLDHDDSNSILDLYGDMSIACEQSLSALWVLLDETYSGWPHRNGFCMLVVSSCTCSARSVCVCVCL